MIIRRYRLSARNARPRETYVSRIIRWISVKGTADFTMLIFQRHITRSGRHVSYGLMPADRMLFFFSQNVARTGERKARSSTLRRRRGHDPLESLVSISSCNGQSSDVK